MKIFAAIYIGSYEVSLKIFGIMAGKSMREIDHVRARVEIGRDAYQKEYIGYELLDELGNLLLDYKRIMEGYRTDAYTAYAGGVFRNIKNELFVLEQLYSRTGIRVQVPSNSEHRFIGYKAIAFREEFNEMIKQGTAIVDVGGGNLQITLFSEGKVISTQHIVLGSMRLHEKLSAIKNAVSHYEKQLEELVDKELESFQSLYRKDGRIKYIIFTGEYIIDLMKKAEKKGSQFITTEKFVKAMRKLYKKSAGQIAAELDLPNEHDPLLAPCVVIYTRIAEELDAEEIWAPGVTVSDGMAYDYAQRSRLLRATHDFDEDILSAAGHLSKRYGGYSPHGKALVQMSLLLFDAMKKVHGMGRRERLLLQTAAILHDCGKYISIANRAQCAYNIIMESEILGLTHLERQMTACIVLYNTHPLESYEELKDRLDQKSYMAVAKLTALIRVANAMDRSHKQKFKNVKASVRGEQLVITLETTDDILLEKGLLRVEAGLFEQVFGIRPEIREKRVFG